MTSTAVNIDLGFSPHNTEGYPDPTAFKALKNLQRAEYGYRPLVYICSPYSGDVASNVELARASSIVCSRGVTAQDSARATPVVPAVHGRRRRERA
ncbi:hypothetical protein [Corynebacterium silvaticum]|uniref:Uncharacterized protein n=1 Tax=Corynebacterium silvaticum TaxID=2320431 RepID=A0ACD4PYF8_9CORY|nr:hypothetical protein [Corynebacterium silvaticum]WCV10535.1 hypothetical protein CBE74_12605 [Corynebacterium silvaticum]